MRGGRKERKEEKKIGGGMEDYKDISREGESEGIE